MSDRVKELREKQAKILADARAMLDSIKDDTPEAEAKEIEAKYDRAMADYDDLEKKVQREEALAAREAKLNEPDPRRPNGDNRQVPGTGEQEKVDLKETFRRWVQFGTEDLSVAERHAMAQLRANVTPEMRAQSTSTTAGGYLIPEGFLPEVEKALKMWGPMMDPGVTRIITTASGNPMPWPTVDDTSNTGALLTENTQDSEQDVTFGQKQLDAYTYTSKIVRVSLQLLQDSGFSIDTLLVDLFGERLGRINNSHLTTGTGSNQPNGIVTASSLGKTAASASAIVADELFDLLHSVDPSYRASPNFRWMFNDNTLKAIRKLKDGNGNYIWQMGDIRTGAPTTLLDKPYVINQAMADISTGTKPIVVGDFSKYIVRVVRDFTMLRLVERYADYLQVGFIAFNRIDGELSNTAAVKHLIMA